MIQISLKRGARERESWWQSGGSNPGGWRVLSSRSRSISVQKKYGEPDLFSSGKQKHVSNVVANATGVRYSLSPIEGKSEKKMPISPSRSLKMENSWNLKYEKGGKDFAGLKPAEDSHKASKCNSSLNVKTRMNSEMGSVDPQSRTFGVRTNGVSTPHPSNSPFDSRKRLKHFRSRSLSEEKSGSVIRKQEMGSNVSSLRGTDNSKTPVTVGSRNFLNENSNNTHIGTLSPKGPKSRCILSFGNIYRSSTNLILETNPIHQKDSQFNSMVPRVHENGLDSRVSEPIRSNSHVLGLGGGNYGHGSIIKGVNNVENTTRTNCLTIANKNREEKQNCPTSRTAQLFESAGELKNVGNEKYRKGHFMEAISFYDKAIALCPRNAAFHNNKAAALAALGRCTEAVGECLEAIDCDPSYVRAHYRLGGLYTRLGRVEDAKWHYKLSGQELGSEGIQRLLHLDTHLTNMKKARKVEDWDSVLTESTLTIEAGADASDHVLAFKAEALLKLHMAEEALELLLESRSRKACKAEETRKSGESRSKKAYKGDSGLLIIETQVFMYLGRFDDAVIAAERAINLDSRPESLMWLRKARAVADARKSGNEFYKVGNYLDACMSYGQGLEHAPTNSVLLCNRAACRSKLGQWEMAVDDCNAALRNRPGYYKALLRRAHSNARLERWEESHRDYTILSQKMPGDLSISHSLLQVQMEFKKAQGARGYNIPVGGEVNHLASYVQFLKPIKSAVPGIRCLHNHNSLILKLVIPENLVSQSLDFRLCTLDAPRVALQLQIDQICRAFRKSEMQLNDKPSDLPPMKC
ncbi:hypothetical protein HHK36_016326 [Tetracentron sinense]|uniref:Uncharacterized protein n=1 Tax=Tetracentron sinense TaxID=13715 RepID=A0A834Z159_TETSI|nr:hypothetical protein HHK36_016326 [Tetracentron sinense]